MIRLRQEVAYTVALAAPLDDGSGVTIIDVLGGMQDVQFTLKLGALFEFHASAHGKLALAFGDPNLLEQVIARGLKPRTPKTIIRPELLRREVAKVRRNGWAMAPDEADLGMNALTAPVFSGLGRYEGSIGIFGSLEQIGPKPPATLIRAVTGAAARISRQLGAR
jgi:DNA-binding IclR family transcriptional regulator